MNVLGGFSGSGVGAVDALWVPAHPTATIISDNAARVRRKVIAGMRESSTRRIATGICNASDLQDDERSISTLIPHAAVLLATLPFRVRLRLVDDDPMVEVGNPGRDIVHQSRDAR